MKRAIGFPSGRARPTPSRALPALAFGLLVACGGGSSGTPAEPGMAPLPAGPHIGSLIAGTTAYRAGTFVWTDYAYDDRGPNADAASGGDRTRSEFAGGDATYPAEAAPGNGADLIELQIGLHQGSVFVWAVLETLVDPAVPVLAVAFDTDRDPATGAPSLPGGRWQVRGALGVEAMVVVAADGASLWQHADGAWREVADFAAVVDPEANLMGATVPAELLRPEGATWNAVAALGLGGAGGSWLDGAAEVFDLAFVGGELLVRWQENKQADVLAGALDASEAIAPVDFSRIAAGEDSEVALGAGFHVFLYRSELRLGEGVAYDDGGNPSFLGPYQPYAVYLPVPAAELARPAPLSVFLHGSSQNHLGSVFQGPTQLYIGTGRALSEDPHLIETLGYAGDGFDFPPHVLQVYPLARGAVLGYRGIAHQDVLDVKRDTERRFAIDPDRVILQGASMGGIGTYRIASLQPDLWSVAFPLIGYQAEPLLPLSANLRNVPVRQINGGADPLIPVEPADASAARLDELGYDYRYWLLADRGHEAGGYIWDCLYAGAVDYVRARQPAHVVYVVDPSLDVIDPESGLDLRFDSAYWVSSIRARDAATLAAVDATSLALPRFEETLERIDRTLDNLSAGRDLCGPNPEIATGDTWRERAVEVERGAPLPDANQLEVTLTNVAALTLDLAGAGLVPASEGALSVASDGPVALALRGLGSGQRVRLGAELRPADADGALVLDLASGESRVALLP